MASLHGLQCNVSVMFASAAVVGLEHVQYSVNEEDGVIKVCAVVSSPDIDCPIDFPFKVKFFTVDVTAGKYYLHIVSTRMCFCAVQTPKTTLQ